MPPCAPRWLLASIVIYMIPMLLGEGFNYSDPNAWGKEFPACSGSMQSPIQIASGPIRTVRGFPFVFSSGCVIGAGQAYFLHSADSSIYLLWNHSECAVTLPNGNALSLGRILFHARGEHTVDGVIPSLEMQLYLFDHFPSTTPSAIVAVRFAIGTAEEVTHPVSVAAFISELFTKGNLPGAAPTEPTPSQSDTQTPTKTPAETATELVTRTFSHIPSPSVSDTHPQSKTNPRSLSTSFLKTATGSTTLPQGRSDTPTTTLDSPTASNSNAPSRTFTHTKIGRAHV